MTMRMAVADVAETSENKKWKKHTKRSKLKSTIKRDIGAWMLILPALLCTYYFIIKPQMTSIYYSFFNMRGFAPTEFVGLENYKRVLTDTMFGKTFFNTCKYVFWSLLVGAVIPFVVAVLMNEMLRFRRTTRVLVYLPAILPAVAVSMLWYFVYYPDASGLLNMMLSKIGVEPYAWLQDQKFTILYIIVSMTWSAMGGTAIFYFSGLQGVDRTLYEAAIIDGAGFFRRIITVTIPQMSGMIILFVVMQIISVFNILEQPLQMTGGGPNNASMSLGLLGYNYGFMQNKPQFSVTLSVIMFVILSVLTVIYFRVNKKIESGQM